MKKLFYGLLFVVCFLFLVPQLAFAADSDGQPIYLKNGNTMQYGKAYYLKDKNLPNRGGITYEYWLSYDYALFSNSPSSMGARIVFEKDGKNYGDIVKSGDQYVSIKSTGSNWDGWVYWVPTSSMGTNSVWLSDNIKRSRMHVISYSKSDNSIGIGVLGAYVGGVVIRPTWSNYEGSTGSKAWMTGDELFLSDGNVPSPGMRTTPFYLYE